jgi:hypothetical protein
LVHHGQAGFAVNAGFGACGVSHGRAHILVVLGALGRQTQQFFLYVVQMAALPVGDVAQRAGDGGLVGQCLVDQGQFGGAALFGDAGAGQVGDQFLIAQGFVRFQACGGTPSPARCSLAM